MSVNIPGCFSLLSVLDFPHFTHINRKLPAQPLQLCRIGDQPTDTADVGFLYVDSLRAQTVDDHKIIREHVRALIIFGRDVLGDGIGQRNGVGAPKRELKDIAGEKRGLAHALVRISLTDRADIKETRTRPSSGRRGVRIADRRREEGPSQGLFLLTAAVLNPGNRRAA